MILSSSRKYRVLPLQASGRSEFSLESVISSCQRDHVHSFKTTLGVARQVIGDQAVFGHRCGMSSHIITPRDGNLSLLIAKVSIGHSAFVGGGSYLGPGVLIEVGALVPAGHNIRPRQRVTRSQSGNTDAPAVQNPL
jgi:acetyltransferase-like isoleucine patch superfamily enzyme